MLDQVWIQNSYKYKGYLFMLFFSVFPKGVLQIMFLFHSNFSVKYFISMPYIYNYQSYMHTNIYLLKWL